MANHSLSRCGRIGRPGVFLVVLAAAVWITHFWHCAGFGLYEDDYARVVLAMELSWGELWSHIRTVFSESAGQGRPLHDILIYLFSHLGNKLAGLQGIYWLAYLIVTANAILFYALLKRLSTRPVFAVTGALAFALFPADTNQAYLTTALGSQPSLTFLLLASYCYLSGRRVISYLVIAGALLCYETVFPVFLAVPLLNRAWDAKLVRTLLRHAAVLGAMLVAVTFLRGFAGEARLSSLDLWTVVTTPLLQMSVGPAVSMAMFFLRPVETLAALDEYLLPFLLPCFAGFAWLLSSVKLSGAANTLHPATSIRLWFSQPEVPAFFRHAGKLALTGLILLVLAYPLTFTIPATRAVGRDSRVHLAAAVGAAVLFACLCSAILYVAAAYRKKWLAAMILAALFTGLAGFGLTVQRDYELSWQYQRALWTDVVRHCPDLADGTVVLVQQTELRETKHIFSWGWAMPRVLRQLYHFPSGWHNPPLLYGLFWNWRDRVVLDGDLFSGIDPKGWILEEVRDPEFGLFEPGDGRLVRHSGPLVINDRQFRLKEPVSPGPPPFPTKLLHGYLIKSADEAPLDYLR